MQPSKAKSWPSSGLVSWMTVIEAAWLVKVQVVCSPSVRVMVTRRLATLIDSPVVQVIVVSAQVASAAWVTV